MKHPNPHRAVARRLPITLAALALLAACAPEPPPARPPIPSDPSTEPAPSPAAPSPAESALSPAAPADPWPAAVSAAARPSRAARALCEGLAVRPVTLRAAAPDEWIVEGLTGRHDQTRGSCGGDGAEAVIPFDAPADGLYVVTTTPGLRFTPVLYARAACADAAAELDCAADDKLAGASLHLDAAAGEHLWILVDGWFGGGGDEPFGLSIRRIDRAAPRFTEARASRRDGADTAWLRVAIADDDADIERVTVTALDADGEALAEPALAWRSRPRPVGVLPTVQIDRPRPLPAGAARLRLVAHDAAGHARALVIPIERARDRRAGALCDRRGHGDGCALGARCDEVADEGRCVDIGRPTVLAADARWHDDTLHLRVEGIGDPYLIEDWRVVPLDALRRPVGLPRVGALRHVRGFSPRTFIGALGWGWLAATPTHLRVEAIDALGEVSAPRIVPIAAVTHASLGGPCDPDGITTACDPDARCLVDAGHARCLGMRPVALDDVSSVIINRERSTYGLSLVGVDRDDIAPERLDVYFAVGHDTFSAPARATLAEACEGDRRCRWQAVGALPDAVAAAVRARPRAAVSVTVQMPGAAPAVIDERGDSHVTRLLGERCAVEQVFDRCEAGAVCEPDDDGVARCQPAPTAPALVDAAARFDAGSGLLGVELVGADPDGDAAALALRLLDADGRVRLEGTWEATRRVIEPDGGFVLRLALALDAGQAVDLIEVTALDARGLVSAPRRVVVAPTPHVGLDASCDPDGAFVRCAAPHACVTRRPGDDKGRCRPQLVEFPEPAPLVSALRKGERCDPAAAVEACAAPYACPDPATGLAPICQPLGLDCPAEWPARDLADFARDGRWIVFGEAGAEHAVPGPSAGCGRTRAQPDMHRFVAPHAGVWRFAVVGEAALAVRGACGVARTLACAAAPDPAAGGITVELEADEVVHLLVDPRVDAVDLHYALVAEPADG